ncbi:MAG: response regulator transcription factor [Chloroflexota bacterium]
MSANKPRALVVDDEPAVRRLLRVALESQGFAVFEAASGQDAVSGAAAHKPDLVILDLGLPDIDGVEVVRLLRQWSRIPIIILSVRGSEKDKIAALDAGADDYLTKPFGMGELIARLRAALRRAAHPVAEPVFVAGDLKVDLTLRLVTVGGCEVQLTPNEYDILKILVLNAGKVLTHRQLLREVWGAEYGDESHMLQVNISNLRRKIEPELGHRQFIVTEPGVGYRLRAD